MLSSSFSCSFKNSVYLFYKLYDFYDGKIIKHKLFYPREANVETFEYLHVYWVEKKPIKDFYLKTFMFKCILFFNNNIER